MPVRVLATEENPQLRKMIRAVVLSDPDCRLIDAVSTTEGADIIITNSRSRSSLNPSILNDNFQLILLEDSDEYSNQNDVIEEEDNVVARLGLPLVKDDLAAALASAKSALLSARASGLAAMMAAYSKCLDRDALSHTGFPCSIEDVIWLESQGNYVELHTPAGSHSMRMTMNRAANLLGSARLVRIHRRYMVNVLRLQRILPDSSGGGWVITASGEQLRVSRRFWRAFQSELNGSNPSDSEERCLRASKNGFELLHGSGIA